MSKPAVLAICLLLLSLRTVAQSAHGTQPDPKIRAGLIKNMVSAIRNYSPADTTPIIDIQERTGEAGTTQTCRINRSGLLRFENGDWVFIRTASAHDNPEGGDVSVAVTNTGKLYVNEGHVCGGIVHFETSRPGKIRGARDFFRQTRADTDGKKWVRYRS